jgi:hypothetical protein
MQIAPVSPHNTEAIMTGNGSVTTSFSTPSAAEVVERIDLVGCRCEGSR